MSRLHHVRVFREMDRIFSGTCQLGEPQPHLQERSRQCPPLPIQVSGVWGEGDGKKQEIAGTKGKPSAPPQGLYLQKRFQGCGVRRQEGIQKNQQMMSLHLHGHTCEIPLWRNPPQPFWWVSTLGCFPEMCVYLSTVGRWKNSEVCWDGSHHLGVLHWRDTGVYPCPEQLVCLPVGRKALK